MSTVIILLIVLAAVCFAVRSIIKGKQRCRNSCASCKRCR